jgi:hypothetical protein
MVAITLRHLPLLVSVSARHSTSELIPQLTAYSKRIPELRAFPALLYCVVRGFNETRTGASTLPGLPDGANTNRAPFRTTRTHM